MSPEEKLQCIGEPGWCSGRTSNPVTPGGVGVRFALRCAFVSLDNYPHCYAYTLPFVLEGIQHIRCAQSNSAKFRAAIA
jgi:hypothetical protein